MENPTRTTPVVLFRPKDFPFLETPWRMENATDLQVRALMSLGLAPYSPLTEEA